MFAYSFTQFYDLQTFLKRSHLGILETLVDLQIPDFYSDKNFRTRRLKPFNLVSRKNGVHLSYSTAISFVKYVTRNRVVQKWQISMWEKEVNCVWKSKKKSHFNVASEARNVYIFSGQKFIKSAKNGQIWRFFWKPETCGQVVLPDRSLLIAQKLVENAKFLKLKCNILRNFQTMWRCSKSVFKCKITIFCS